MLEIFGTAAVALMVLCYALEARGPHMTLAFAGACVLAALYALAIRAWPFAAVETVWAGVAWSRHRRLRRSAREIPPEEAR